MISNYTDIAFSESVKSAQQEFGSREMYQKVQDRKIDQTILTGREVALIEAIDGFYMATVNEDGWPYVQFRGGPRGFLKVLDVHTIGYADFRGNMQYISTGNIRETKKTSLILMHYPSKTRLKIWAETEILNPKDHPELAGKLLDEEYDAEWRGW